MWQVRSSARLSILALWATLGFRLVFADIQPQKRELDPPWTTDPSQFHRRAWHSSEHAAPSGAI
jgi:hypothetical protein